MTNEIFSYHSLEMESLVSGIQMTVTTRITQRIKEVLSSVFGKLREFTSKVSICVKDTVNSVKGKLCL